MASPHPASADTQRHPVMPRIGPAREPPPVDADAVDAALVLLELLALDVLLFRRGIGRMDGVVEGVGFQTPAIDQRVEMGGG